MYLPCLLPPTQAFIFCSLDSYYPWVIRGGESCRWLRCIIFPIPMLLWYIRFLKIFQRVFPVETAFLIQFSFPFLYHVSRKAPAKGWPAASASSMIPCIQSLVSLLFLYSWVLLACQAFLRPGNGTVLQGLMCSAFFTKPWLTAWVAPTLPFSAIGKILRGLVLCCFLCVSVGSHRHLGERMISLIYIYAWYTVIY